MVQTIPEFFRNNIRCKNRNGLNCSRFCNLIGNIKQLPAGPVRVYHTLGVTPEMMSNYGFNGKKTIELFEEALNKYGFSISRKLMPGQIRELDRICSFYATKSSHNVR